MEGKDALKRGELALALAPVRGWSHTMAGRDVVVRFICSIKCAGCLENRHIGRKRPPVYTPLGGTRRLHTSVSVTMASAATRETTKTGIPAG